MEVKKTAMPKRLVLAASIAAMLGAAPAFAQDANEVKVFFRDGLRFESVDKQHSFGITGRVHFDYRSFSPSDSVADTFDVRRARLGFNGKVFNDINFELVGDFGSSAKLDVGWINYRLAGSKAQVRVGQFKMPFSLQQLMSSNNITFQERAMMDALVPAKEPGIMLHGSPTAGMTYAIAASNGAGQNATESDAREDDKDFMGRLTFNIPEMIGNKDIIGHLGIAYTTTTQPGSATVSTTGGVRTSGRGATFFTGSAPGATNPYDRTRLGLEAAFATGPFKIQAEWMNAEYDVPDSLTRELDTYYIYGAWAITGESFAKTYRNGVFGGIKPARPYGQDGGAGAWVLGVRYDKFDAGDFAAGTFTASGGATVGTREADAITIGVTWHPTSMTRFMLNYVMTDYDTPVTVGGALRDDEKAITLRAQINW
jgi:phosphate-selective porin OprO and OprP